MKINDSKKQVIFKDYSKVHTKKECLEICKNNQIEIDNVCYNDLSNIANLLFQNG